MKNYFNNTSHQQILTFLADHPDRSFFDKEIAQATRLSAGATNKALRELAQEGYIDQEKKGRMRFYSVDLANPIIRQFKVLLNVTIIYPLVQKLKKVAKRVVLFGSAAEGTNIRESDIDLFALTNNPKQIAELVHKSPLAEKIQLVAKKPVDFASLKKRDPVFYEEIERGIVLWEAK